MPVFIKVLYMQPKNDIERDIRSKVLLFYVQDLLNDLIEENKEESKEEKKRPE